MVLSNCEGVRKLTPLIASTSGEEKKKRRRPTSYFLDSEFQTAQARRAARGSQAAFNFVARIVLRRVGESRKSRERAGAPRKWGRVPKRRN